MRQDVTSTNRKKWLFLAILFCLLLAQLGTAAYFGSRKKGFHFDEYYSYYSSNVTYQLFPTDREWKDTDEIRSEFMVLPGQGFQYGTVARMQSYDVHPPVYYLLLHTVCSLFPGSFSKWTGLGLNMVFFAACFACLAWLAYRLSGGSRAFSVMVCLLYGFNPGILSGVMLIRMYQLLSLWLLALTCLHVSAILRGRRTFFRFYLPLMVITYLGFLTHYYFLVYLFFLAAAFACRLFFPGLRQDWRKNCKDVLFYSAAIGSALLLAIVSFPSCLAQIFRGYRGQGALDAFFDFSNTGQRLSFFFGLLDTYAFGNMLPIVLLAILLLICARQYVRVRTRRLKLIEKAEEDPAEKDLSAVRGARGNRACRDASLIVAIAVLGYFLVVAKTALLTYEQANRYELPVYALAILLTLLAVYRLARQIWRDGKARNLGPFLSVAVLSLLLAVSQLVGIRSGKVLFLFEEDTADYAFAKDHVSDAVVYFYNPDQSWMIWDDSTELMEYPQIYFVSLADPSGVTDTRLLASPSLIVYAMRTPQTETALSNLMASNPVWERVEQIGARQYCDVYSIR